MVRLSLKCAAFKKKPRRELTPHDFERHVWQKREDISPWYVFYRWIQFASFAIVCIISIVNGNKYAETDSTRWKWLIFLTNWAYSACTIQSFVAMIIVQLALINKAHINDGRTRVGFWYKFYHAMFTVALVTSSSVTVMYWMVVHNPKEHSLDALNLMVHAGNSVAMYVDFFLVKMPWRFWLMGWPLLCGTMYSLFSFAYFSFGGTDRNGNPYVYQVLDWRNPLKSIAYTMVCLSLQVFFHTIILIIYKLRKKCISCAKYEEDILNSNEPLTLQEKPILITVS